MLLSLAHLRKGNKSLSDRDQWKQEMTCNTVHGKTADAIILITKKNTGPQHSTLWEHSKKSSLPWGTKQALHITDQCYFFLLQHINNYFPKIKLKTSYCSAANRGVAIHSQRWTRSQVLTRYPKEYLCLKSTWSICEVKFRLKINTSQMHPF